MLAVALVLAFVGAAVPAPAANLITNGSFEAGPSFVPVGNMGQLQDWMYVPSGSPALAGWSVSMNGVDWCRTFITAAHGQFSIDINHDTPGRVTQTITTATGHDYRLAFSYAANPFIYTPSPAIRKATVTVADLSFVVQYDATGHTLTNPGWTDYTTIFTAVSDHTTLSFTGLSSGGTGIIIDSVVIEPVITVPEPASLLFLVCGMLGMLACGASRRRA